MQGPMALGSSRGCKQPEIPLPSPNRFWKPRRFSAREAYMHRSGGLISDYIYLLMKQNAQVEMTVDVSLQGKVVLIL